MRAKVPVTTSALTRRHATRQDNIRENYHKASALNPKGLAREKEPMLFVDVKVKYDLSCACLDVTRSMA